MYFSKISKGSVKLRPKPVVVSWIWISGERESNGRFDSVGELTRIATTLPPNLEIIELEVKIPHIFG